MTLLPSSNDKTLYTLNLKNAWKYFYEQLKICNRQAGFNRLREIYANLTQKFLFNVYIIEKVFDPCVVFETMNNRGKQLSGLEKLKNRLIYLTTLYPDKELDLAKRESLRNSINDAWTEVYYQLGRNDKNPLKDDDFLKAHWIMYFRYEKDKSCIDFLLDEEFSLQKVHKETASETNLVFPEEQRTSFEMEDVESDEEFSPQKIHKETASETDLPDPESLPPDKINDYVVSLKESAVHWFNSHYPYLSKKEQQATRRLSEREQNALDRLNKIGMGYFRPLVMSVFKNEKNREKRIDLLDQIERFIFIVFRLRKRRRNAHQIDFFRASSKFNRGDSTLETIKTELNGIILKCFSDPDEKVLDSKPFRDFLAEQFQQNKEGKNKGGYYKWTGLRYFLYEYELSLRSQNGQQEVGWIDPPLILKEKGSIEHVFPQTPKDPYWKKFFGQRKYYPRYSNSIGNFLLLSKSINNSIKNDSFKDKKEGYSRSGLLSAKEVSEYQDWGPEEIRERGLHLLSFMEDRWDFKFKNEQAKEDLLFLPKSGDR